jgi:hypothetical protein
MFRQRQAALLARVPQHVCAAAEASDASAICPERRHRHARAGSDSLPANTQGRCRRTPEDV